MNVCLRIPVHMKGLYHAYLRLPEFSKLNFCVFCIRTVPATRETTHTHTNTHTSQLSYKTSLPTAWLALRGICDFTVWAVCDFAAWAVCDFNTRECVSQRYSFPRSFQNSSFVFFSSSPGNSGNDAHRHARTEETSKPVSFTSFASNWPRT